MIKKKEITVSLSLTRDEWCELVNSLDTKAMLIEEGRYGDEENPGDDAAWAATLRSASDKVGAALNKKGIPY